MSFDSSTSQFGIFTPSLNLNLNSSSMAFKGNWSVGNAYDVGLPTMPSYVSPPLPNPLCSGENTLITQYENTQQFPYPITQYYSILCGSLDTVKTCSLGQSMNANNNANGDCKNCTYNKGWNFEQSALDQSHPINCASACSGCQGPVGKPGGPPSTCQIPASQMNGTIGCTYSYDFSNYDTYISQNNPRALYAWLVQMQGNSFSAPQGLPPIVYNRFRDSNIVYAISLDYYNQMYDPNSVSPLSQVDLYTVNTYTDFLNNYIQSQYSCMFPLYPGGIPPQQFLSAIVATLSMPKAYATGTSFYIDVPLNYNQTETYLSQMDRDGWINTTIQYFLRDSQGSLNNNGVNLPINNCILYNSSISRINALQLYDSNQNAPVYNAEVFLNYSDFMNKIGLATVCMFMTAVVTAEIKRWSPMLVALYQLTNPTIPPALCQQMYADCNVYPSSYFNQICSSPTADCKNFIQTNCSINYVNPPFTKNNLLFSSNRQECWCYNTALQPPSIAQGGNTKIMCFDTNCTSNPLMMSLFDLTNSTMCQQGCNYVQNYVTSSDPTERSGNVSDVDHSQYISMCGHDIKPLASIQTNYQVLVVGIAITILAGMLAFAIAKHSSYTSGTTIALVFFTILTLGGLTAFLCKDLAGISMCDSANPGKKLCHSQYTHISLPLSFCETAINCECTANNSGCSPSCNCVSGVCLPKDGSSRPKQLVSTTNPNIPLYVTTIIASIILFVLLLYLYDDYHWPIDFTEFVILCTCIVLSIISYSTYANFKTIKKLEYVGSCN